MGESRKLLIFVFCIALTARRVTSSKKASLTVDHKKCSNDRCELFSILDDPEESLDSTTVVLNVDVPSTVEPTYEEAESVRNITVTMDLKWVHFRPDKLNESSRLFGRLNENVSVGVFFVPPEDYRNVALLFGSKLRGISAKYSVFDDNDYIERLFVKLAGIMWPYSPENRYERRLFVLSSLLEMGFIRDDSEESHLDVYQFERDFSLDPFLNESVCPDCFCSVFSPNGSVEDLKYLLCFSPWYSYEQQKILYNEYLREANYIDYTGYSSIISAFFLFITLIIYCILPELRSNTYGKCLVLYLIAFCCSSLGLGLIVLIPRHLGFLCFPTGFSVQFFWLTGFSMQSVLCFDILKAFSVLRNPRVVPTYSDNAMVGLYCIYGYGLPAIITLVTVALQFGPFLEDGNRWKPNMIRKYCFFPKSEDMTVRWTYFYGPYSVMIFINFCMFVVTATLIIKQSMHSRAFRGSFRKTTANKQNNNMFRAHLTLFFVMGSNWLSEVIILVLRDTTTPDNLFWQVLDTINTLFGVFLFVILIFRPNVIKALKKQIRLWYSKTSLHSQTTDGSNTKSTSI